MLEFILKRNKLRLKFILVLVTLTIVPLVFATAITIGRLQEAQRENVIVHNRHIAQIANGKIETFLISQFQTLKNIGLAYPQSFRDQSSQEFFVEQLLYKSGNFADLAIVDSEGSETIRKNVLEVIRPSQLKDRSKSTEFLSVQKTGHYIGPQYIEQGKPYFLLGEQILGPDGSFRGAVFAQVDARVMQDVVKNISAGSGGRAYIVNRQGIVIAHPDISRVLRESDFSHLPVVASAINPDSATDPLNVYINDEEQKVLGVGIPIVASFPDNPSHAKLEPEWTIVVEQPAAVALQIVSDITRFSLMLLFVVLLAVSIVAVIFGRRIVRPIEQLYVAAKRLGAGDLDYRVAIKTNDELEDLAQGFNGMAKRLKASIADLKRDQRLIEGERNKLTMVLSGIRDAVIAVDLQNHIVIFNKAAQQLTGLQRTNALDRPVNEVLRIFENDRELAVHEYCPMQPGKREGVIFTGENLKLLPRQGVERFVNLTTGQIRGGTSINLGCILTIQDITREHLVEKMKTDFVSIAAHQLRTPLSAIKWAIRLLLDGEAGNISRGQEKLVEAAYESNERMIALVNDLLNVARIEEGRYLHKPTLEDIQEFIRSVIPEVKEKAKQKNITLRVQEPKYELPLALLDTRSLKLVLQNLLENAIQYTRAKGKVIVSTTLQNDEIVVSVQDTGIGISQEEKNRVFTKFFRGKEAVSMETAGSGLGLFIAKNTVEAHNGRIWFESERGKGTTFYFTIPVDNQKVDSEV